MKINFTYSEICSITKGRSLTEHSNPVLTSISFDTRKIVQGQDTLFFALIGDFRNGHLFIQEAFSKGVRFFVISQEIDVVLYPEAAFILVENSLWALQEIAKTHREKFSFPIVAITGSVGKTMVKEWAYHFLAPKLRVIRSPKSFNSQLGVALSLLELHENCDVALIEVGISKPNEMARLQEIIQPTIGIFTAFGSAHQENFDSKESHLEEKLTLFSECLKTYYHSSIELNSKQISEINGIEIYPDILDEYKKNISIDDKVSLHNLEIAVQIAHAFSIPETQISAKISSLPRLALRMETFEGINGNTIINDTYNLDFDALTQSLEYQYSLAKMRQRYVIIGLDDESLVKKEDVDKLILPFHPDKVIYIDSDSEVDHIENSVILIKGTRKADMHRVARQYRLKNHKTFLEIDLNHIRNNLGVYKGYLKPKTKILAMVKSNSYGSGTEKMAAFYEQQGVDYLGVAYVDEGVELRKQGITTPILVMNAEEDGFEDCIAFNLEPAIYSFEQLDQFIKELIFLDKTDYPIHLKVNTGMMRLGFEVSEISQVMEILQAQPEVKIKSVYSHLADSDNSKELEFSNIQIKRFEKAWMKIQEYINYPFDRHILNSEGVSRFPDAQYEMVRLGIGIYGYSSNPEFKKKIQPAISWNSSISQIKKIRKGESVGYGRAFIADSEMKIAVIPVGYADGFRRSLSNGKGSVFILDKCCKVLGRVCMDMIMVDITGVDCLPGTPVEIIGKNQTMEQFASKMDTIPYEVMTSFSKRVHRVYVM